MVLVDCQVIPGTGSCAFRQPLAQPSARARPTQDVTGRARAGPLDDGIARKSPRAEPLVSHRGERGPGPRRRDRRWCPATTGGKHARSDGTRREVRPPEAQ